MLELKLTQVGPKLRRELGEVQLSLGSGEAVAVVGPANSGKSALLAVVAGVRRDYEGKVTIHHHNLQTQPKLARQLVGYLPNPFVPPAYLTGFEYLEVTGTAYNLAPQPRLKRINELSGALKLADELYRPLEQVTGSVLQKVGLAASLLADSPVIIWDEPTLRLDYLETQAVAEIAKTLLDKKKSLFFTSNDLRFTALVAERYCFLEEGQIIASGRLSQVANQLHCSPKTLETIYAHLYSR